MSDVTYRVEFVFQRLHFKDLTYKHSIVFPSREEAEAAIEKNKRAITWKLTKIEKTVLAEKT